MLDIFQDSRNAVSFRTPQGQEVLRIVKQNNWSSWKTITHCGVRGDGVEMWRLKISSRWMGTEYGESPNPRLLFLLSLLCAVGNVLC